MKIKDKKLIEITYNILYIILIIIIKQNHNVLINFIFLNKLSRTC